MRGVHDVVDFILATKVLALELDSLGVLVTVKDRDAVARSVNLLVDGSHTHYFDLIQAQLPLLLFVVVLLDEAAHVVLARRGGRGESFCLPLFLLLDDHSHLDLSLYSFLLALLDTHLQFALHQGHLTGLLHLQGRVKGLQCALMLSLHLL